MSDVTDKLRIISPAPESYWVLAAKILVPIIGFALFIWAASLYLSVS